MITDLHYGVKKNNPGYSVNPVFTQAVRRCRLDLQVLHRADRAEDGRADQLPADHARTTQYTTKNCPQDGDGKAYIAHNAGRYADTLPLDQALPESSNTYFVAMEDEFFGCNICARSSTPHSAWA